MSSLPGHIADFIKNEFTNRVTKNSKYSMRAFARDLDISPATLTNILKKQSGLSVQQAESIAQKLNLVLEEKDFFHTLNEKDFARSKTNRSSADARLYRYETRYNTLTSDTFILIKEWYHLAIMELTKVEGFSEEAEWIAGKLHITVTEAQAAMERLIRLEILERVEGRLQPSKDYLIILSKPDSEAVKSFQVTILEKLMASLDNQPRTNRDIASIVMSFNKDQLEEVKEDIKNFRRDLSLKLQLNPHHDSVYCLTTAFFQLDH